MNENKKNRTVQCFRGLFCLFIMGYHFTSRFSELYHYQLPSFVYPVSGVIDYIGMGCFCFITGYYTYHSKRDNTSVCKNILHRFRRLYPAYLSSVIIIYVASLLGSAFLGDRKVSFLVFLENTVFLNIPLQSGFVDGAHWYVVFIMGINIFYSIMAKMRRVMESRWFWIAQHSVFCLAMIIGFVYPTSLKSYVLYTSLVSLGVFYKLYSYALADKITLYLVTALQTVTIFFSESLIHSLLLIAFLLALCAGMNENRKKTVKISDSNALSWIGDRSYHIYLIHQNIGYMVINCMLYFGLPYVSGLIFAIMIAICLGNILYYLDNKIST